MRNNIWISLETELSGWLKSIESDQLEYKGPNQSIPGFPSDGFRSDGLLTDGFKLLAIEVEAAQMNPDTNVGKYWLLQERFKKYQEIVLFHIYTPKFSSYPWRKQLAEYLAEKIQEDYPFEYILLDYRAADDFDETLEEIISKMKP